MDRNSFAGTSFSTIFWSAMRKVFTNENSDPGMIEKGEIWQQVEQIIDWNTTSSRSPIGFSRDAAERILYFGDFGNLKLSIEGPDIPEDINFYAKATLNRGRIWFNFYKMINAANSAFPKNSRGVDMLVYWTGAVMLHEVMHCMGFSHAARVDNDPTHPYNRTLPQVAYRAVLGASPYAGQILFLTPGGTQIRPMFCGTNSTEAVFTADAIDPAEVVVPPNMPEIYTEAAYENFMQSLETQETS